jgi:hypothetical protein
MADARACRHGCSLVAKLVSVDDVVARRPASPRRWRTALYREVSVSLQTPHVPHCWEASLLFEETQGTPQFRLIPPERGRRAQHQRGCVGRFRQMLVEYQQGPLRTICHIHPTLSRCCNGSSAQAPHLGNDARVDVRWRWRAGPRRLAQVMQEALGISACRLSPTSCSPNHGACYASLKPWEWETSHEIGCCYPVGASPRLKSH